MFTLDGVQKFHDWTHSSLSRMLDHIATLPEGSYHTKLNGFGFATIGEQVLHIFQCETNWIHRAQAIPFDGLSISEYPAIRDARVLQGKVRSETSAYLSGLTEQQLNEEITLRSYDGFEMTCTPAHVIHHVLTHAFHHKGQIVSMCRMLGHPAPDTDVL
jgi:uncharacterized damage-inducible protein DinB